MRVVRSKVDLSSTLVSKPYRMFGATAAKTRLPITASDASPSERSIHRQFAIGGVAARPQRQTAGQLIDRRSCRSSSPRPSCPCAARETDWPGNRRRAGARAAARGGSGCGLSSGSIVSPIEMPGGVPEQRNDDGKAEEERQRSRHQQYRDDQSPGRHRHRIACDRAQRRHHRIAGAGMTIEHQRERHHADAKRDEREQEADAAADHDQPPALRTSSARA